jgi:hypothetical protein
MIQRELAAEALIFKFNTLAKNCIRGEFESEMLVANQDQGFQTYVDAESSGPI